MSAAITFKIEGLDKVLKAIDSYNNKVQDGVDNALTEMAFKTVTDAQQLSPIDDSNLRHNIGFVNERFAKALYSNAAYSAYIEFGTGANVDVPVMEGIDLPEYAMTFFVNGRGHTRPHPYFFPAIQKNIPNLVKTIEKVLEGTKP